MTYDDAIKAALKYLEYSDNVTPERQASRAKVAECYINIANSISQREIKLKKLYKDRD